MIYLYAVAYEVTADEETFWCVTFESPKGKQIEGNQSYCFSAAIFDKKEDATALIKKICGVTDEERIQFQGVKDAAAFIPLWEKERNFRGGKKVARRRYGILNASESANAQKKYGCNLLEKVTTSTAGVEASTYKWPVLEAEKHASFLDTRYGSGKFADFTAGSSAGDVSPLYGDFDELGLPLAIVSVSVPPLNTTKPKTRKRTRRSGMDFGRRKKRPKPKPSDTSFRDPTDPNEVPEPRPDGGPIIRVQVRMDRPSVITENEAYALAAVSGVPLRKFGVSLPDGAALGDISTTLVASLNPVLAVDPLILNAFEIFYDAPPTTDADILSVFRESVDGLANKDQFFVRWTSRLGGSKEQHLAGLWLPGSQLKEINIEKVHEAWKRYYNSRVEVTRFHGMQFQLSVREGQRLYPGEYFPYHLGNNGTNITPILEAGEDAAPTVIDHEYSAPLCNAKGNERARVYPSKGSTHLPMAARVNELSDKDPEGAKYNANFETDDVPLFHHGGEDDAENSVFFPSFVVGTNGQRDVPGGKAVVASYGQTDEEGYLREGYTPRVQAKEDTLYTPLEVIINHVFWRDKWFAELNEGEEDHLPDVPPAEKENSMLKILFQNNLTSREHPFESVTDILLKIVCEPRKHNSSQFMVKNKDGSGVPLQEHLNLIREDEAACREFYNDQIVMFPARLIKILKLWRRAMDKAGPLLLPTFQQEQALPTFKAEPPASPSGGAPAPLPGTVVAEAAAAAAEDEISTQRKGRKPRGFYGGQDEVDPKEIQAQYNNQNIIADARTIAEDDPDYVSSLEDKEYCFVGKSLIAGADLGLKAKVYIPEGKVIAHFYGDAWGTEHRSEYAVRGMYIDPDNEHVVDVVFDAPLLGKPKKIERNLAGGATHESKELWGRDELNAKERTELNKIIKERPKPLAFYANTHESEDKINAKIVADSDYAPFPYIVAIKAIKPTQEIFIDYGDEHKLPPTAAEVSEVIQDPGEAGVADSDSSDDEGSMPPGGLPATTGGAPAPRSSRSEGEAPSAKKRRGLTPEEAAEILKKEGYLLVPLEEGSSKELGALFEEYLEHIPEYTKQGPLKPLKEGGSYSPGSFGAINLASAYHCPFAVESDLRANAAVRPIIEALARDLGRKHTAQDPDRICFRNAKQRAESWHTDNTGGAFLKSDIYIGGTLNADPKGESSQVFTLVPKSHTLGAKGGGESFTPAKDKATYDASAEKIVIPPDHVLIYFENIVHCISGKKSKEFPFPWYRKFVAWHLSDSPEQWCKEYNGQETMIEQGPLAHKGGVIAPMYPRLWLTNHWKTHLIPYGKRLVPGLTTKHKFESGNFEGETIDIPVLEPLSLEKLGLPKYPQSDEARDRFLPTEVQPAGSSARNPILIL